MPTPAPLPSLEQFAVLVASAHPKHRAVVRLHTLLEHMGQCEGQEPRVRSLLELMKWLRSTGKLPDTASHAPADSPFTARVRLLVDALERVEGARDILGGTLRDVLEQSNPMELFARLGLPEDRSFLAEMADRFWTSVLPSGLDDCDAAGILIRLFPSRQSLDDLVKLPIDLWGRIVCVLSLSSQSPGVPLTAAMVDALRLVALRLSASGLFDALRHRSPTVDLVQSPFFRLPQAASSFIQELNPNAPGDPNCALMCHQLVTDCKAVTRAVVENLERSGVSVDVVYRLEAIGKALRRYADLVSVLDTTAQPEQSHRLLASLVDAGLRNGELSEIVRSSTHLLARKIIERAGETGEHYITNTRKEYFHLLASAAGGGILTCATTVFKYLIMWVHFAPLLEGVFAAINYAGSFLVMQLLGFTLATKQPSMTAAAVAASMREKASSRDLSGLVTMIARVTRSQLAAAIGNLGLVIPTAALFDFYWRATHRVSFLDADTASYVLHSLSPFSTGTLYYAAFTGVLLWVSSMGAGWFENWFVYRRIPQAIENHRVRRFLGRGVTSKLSRALHRNISGIGGNITLGTLLGLMPVLGKFVGIPLDVRHVTLSTGALTLAVCAQGKPALFSHELREAALGVIAIGILNFGVSFIFALLVALRAKEVGLADRFRLLVSVVVTFVRSPLQFLFPSATSAQSVHGPVSRRGSAAP